MNKIVNWTLGSFFRTLGRILVYIILGILLSYLIKDIKLPIIDLFQVLDVSADTIRVDKTDEEVFAYINNNLFDNYYNLSAITQNQDATFRISLTTLESLSTNYPYIIVDICSTANLYVYRTASLGNSCTNSCFSNQVSITKINYECTSNGYQGNIYRIKAPISKWGPGVDTETSNVSDQFSIGANIGYYAPNTIYGIYLTDDMNDNLQQIDYSSTMNNINNSINNQTQQQHQDHQDTMNTITDDTPPDNLNALSNSAGWLPAGPVDSILNLPLNFLNSLFNNLSKTCTPVKLPLPYVNKELELPCVNSLYAQIDGVPTWINTTVGLIASAFILFSYLLRLYKYIDDTLTFRENNFIDNWSGV